MNKRDAFLDGVKEGVGTFIIWFAVGMTAIGCALFMGLLLRMFLWAAGF